MTDRIGDHYVPNLKCAWCDAPADGALNAVLDDHAPPKPGDFCVCAYCAQPNVYTVMGLGRLLSLKNLRTEEREQVEKSMRIVRSAPKRLRLTPTQRLYTDDR